MFTGSCSSKFTDIDVVLLNIWCALVVLYFLLEPHPSLFFFWSLTGGLFLICRHVYRTIFCGLPTQYDIVAAGLLPLMVLGAGGGGWVWLRSPHTFDACLAKWDFGLSPAVFNWTLHHYPIYYALLVLYGSLPFFVALCVALLPKPRDRVRLLVGVLLGGLLCPICYLLCPAVGPIHVGDPLAPRNCMPSMHVTWALILLFNARGRFRWLFGVFVILTAWSTLSTGEHYVPDLVAAIPWGWALYWVSLKVIKERDVNKAEGILTTS